MILLKLKEQNKETRLTFERFVLFESHLTIKERLWNRGKDYGVVYLGFKFKVITQHFLVC